MRKILTILSLCALIHPFESLGQKITLPSDSLTIQKIIEVPETSKDLLQIMTKKWFNSKLFVANSRNPSIIENTADRIKATYQIEYRSQRTWYRSWQTITIEVRDNMIRVTIDNPYHKLIYDKGTRKERLVESKNTKGKYEVYGAPLRFIRNTWRKDIDDLKSWLLIGYKIAEEEAMKNAQFK